LGSATKRLKESALTRDSISNFIWFRFSKLLFLNIKSNNLYEKMVMVMVIMMIILILVILSKQA
jgi:hypothetical protein